MKVREERQKAARKKVRHRQRNRQKQKEKAVDLQSKIDVKDRKQKTGKVEHRKRKTMKSVGSEKTKIKKYMFHLNNRLQQREEGRKRRN